MSKNTVRKYVESLEEKGFISTEPTKVKTKDGRTHNGSLLYTVQPLKPIEEAYLKRKLAIVEAEFNTQKALEQYEKRKERS